MFYVLIGVFCVAIAIGMLLINSTLEEIRDELRKHNKTPQ